MAKKTKEIEALEDAMFGGFRRPNADPPKETQGDPKPMKSVKYNAPSVKVDTTKLQKAPKIDPSKLKKKTLKEELAEMGDPEKIRKEAEDIDQDLLDLLKKDKPAASAKKPAAVEKGKLTITHEKEGDGTEIIDKGQEEEGDEENADQLPLDLFSAPTKGKKVTKGLYHDELEQALETFRGTELYPDALVILGRIQRAGAARRRIDAEREAYGRVFAWNRNDLGKQNADEVSPEAKEWDRLWIEEQMARADLEELQAKLFEITAESMRAGITKALKPFLRKAVPSAMPEPDPEELKEKQKEEAEKKADSSEEEDEDAEKGADLEDVGDEDEGGEDVEPEPVPTPAPAPQEKKPAPAQTPAASDPVPAPPTDRTGDVKTLDDAKKNDAPITPPKSSDVSKGKKTKDKPAC